VAVGGVVGGVGAGIGCEEFDQGDSYPLTKARIFSKTIPMGAPGHELRTFFDSHIERHGKGLPPSHEVTISYTDSHSAGRRRRRKPWVEKSIVDLDPGNGLLYTEIYGTHHAAKALREIERLLKNAPVLKKNGHVDVVTETRDENKARIAKANAERKAQLERWRAEHGS
jgi:hypothetical protein